MLELRAANDFARLWRDTDLPQRSSRAIGPDTGPRLFPPTATAHARRPQAFDLKPANSNVTNERVWGTRFAGPIDGELYQVTKRLTLLPISQISRDLIQRCGGGFEMAAPVLLRGDFDGPMLRALVLAEKAGSVTRRLLSLVTIYDGGSRADAALLGGVGLRPFAIGSSGLISGGRMA